MLEKELSQGQRIAIKTAPKPKVFFLANNTEVKICKLTLSRTE